MKTQKNKALLEVFYKKELYKRLLFIVTEDGVSNHREKAIEYFQTFVEEAESLTEETVVILTSIAGRMSKLPYAEP